MRTSLSCSVLHKAFGVSCRGHRQQQTEWVVFSANLHPDTKGLSHSLGLLGALRFVTTSVRVTEQPGGKEAEGSKEITSLVHLWAPTLDPWKQQIKYIQNGKKNAFTQRFIEKLNLAAICMEIFSFSVSGGPGLWLFHDLPDS